MAGIFASRLCKKALPFDEKFQGRYGVAPIATLSQATEPELHGVLFCYQLPMRGLFGRMEPLNTSMHQSLWSPIALGTIHGDQELYLASLYRFSRLDQIPILSMVFFWVNKLVETVLVALLRSSKHQR
ncbi:hypothetical protein SODALDRAFT_21037 [Sodiomyces alkalinus F11]|uniref:Uncharacterized protein n=1 Tax=Sodiomyces alkalinus (strain CBS 110278 / VKM F-3762 / F11) TaxID=1314773 RepID=A0A3N2Q7D9_SODAK|nr:hypothetical protein SODALDRAFT_21037 [Sodiomyces alkalinus F11]ROT42691.1 hypothetical protein SODALDRAFT_21037 [Sodiomyces alkalinus F11]